MSVRSSEHRIRWILTVTSVGVLIALVIAAIWNIRFLTEQPSPTRSDSARLSTPTTKSTDLATVPVDVESSWIKIDDPNLDGWDSEALSDEIGSALNALGQLIVHPERINITATARIADEGFACGALLPESRQTVFDDKAIRVERAQAGPSSRDPKPAAVHQGPAGLAEALRAVAAPFRNASDVRFKFKLVQLDLPAV